MRPTDAGSPGTPRALFASRNCWSEADPKAEANIAAMHPPTLRRLRADEMATPLAWAAAEGWNPGRHDGPAFHAADPEGFFLAEVEGAPAATISAVRYGAAFGFLGFYIVAPALRGRGLGRAVWSAALGHLGERAIGLDGVLAQQERYAAEGFRYRYRHVRYRGKGFAGVAAVGVRSIEPGDFAAIHAYDRRCFGADRAAFLRAWLAPPEGAAIACIGDAGVRGYGVLRACAEGAKIGPLFADDDATADALFRALASTAPHEPIYLDIPDINPAARALAERYGMDPVFEAARMYRGEAPATPLGNEYGVTTLELG